MNPKHHVKRIQQSVRGIRRDTGIPAQYEVLAPDAEHSQFRVVLRVKRVAKGGKTIGVERTVRFGPRYDAAGAKSMIRAAMLGAQAEFDQRERGAIA